MKRDVTKSPTFEGRGEVSESKCDTIWSCLEEAQQWLTMICGQINAEQGSPSTTEKIGKLEDDISKK